MDTKPLWDLPAKGLLRNTMGNCVLWSQEDLQYNGSKEPRSVIVGPSREDASTLTGVSVSYHNEMRDPKVRMSKTGRAAARQALKPFGMSSTRKRIKSVDPAQNNVNDYGAKIIPQGQGPM